MPGEESRASQPAASLKTGAAHPFLTAETLGQRTDSRRKGRVALVDEFSLRRAGTINLLRREGHENALSFRNVDELLAYVDLDAGTLSGVIVCVGARSVSEPSMECALRRLIDASSPIPTVVLSDRDDSAEAVAAFRLGARGYIPTSLEPCLAAEALRIVLAGGAFIPADMLMRARRQPQIEAAPIRAVPAPVEPAEARERWSPRQLSVLRLLAKGMANKEIARELAMEESTVKVHVRHIMRKLGATNRTQAALSARRLGLPFVGERPAEAAIAFPELKVAPSDGSAQPDLADRDQSS